MKSIHTYQFTVHATHEKYPPDISVHFIAADTYEEAAKHVRNNLENAGWKIEGMVEKLITVWDIRQ